MSALLNIGGIKLPLDAVTQTFGILAVRGAGKSNLAAAMAEEMFEAELPFVVIDPVGSWWGLLSSTDGKAKGLPITVFGGRHGHVPLERTGGQLIADLIVDKRLTCVLDVSDFSEGDKVKFLCDFAERLYRRNTEPLHLFLEEADDFIPQRPFREQARLLRAWENIVRRGRARGLGITMITQRSAALNKNVLTQIETLFVLRTTSPQDRDAIERWVKYQGASDAALESLPGLGAGEAWVWSPSWLKVFKRIQVRRRWTFDSGATPKLQKSTQRPATLADVDISAITAAMAETIERAKQEDPRELRKRIADLEREARTKPTPLAPTPKTAPRDKRLQEENASLRAESSALRSQLRALQKLGAKERWEAGLAAVANGIERFRKLGDDLVAAINADPPPSVPVTTSPIVLHEVPTRIQRTQHPPRIERSHHAPRGDADPNIKLGAAHRAMLTVLAQREGRPIRRNQLAVFSGYSAKSTHIDNVLSTLRTAGYVQGGGNALIATKEGLSALGPYKPLPTGEQLRAYWITEVGRAAGAMLQTLIDEYPSTLTREEIAKITGYSTDSTHIDNCLSTLRTMELIVGGRGELRASDDLFA